MGDKWDMNLMALYHIKGWMPCQEMSGSGFCICLYPEFKREVARGDVDQDGVNNYIKNMGKRILDGHGYQSDHYAVYSLRITWGEWGPEHITVPGNACGLDIDRHGLGAPGGGVILLPHNVDSTKQASILLTLFLSVAGILETNRESRWYAELTKAKGK